jgi:hypothetical protein
LSVLLHGGVALLLLMRLAEPPSSESEPGRLTIINAELLLDGMQSAAAGPAAANLDAEENERPQHGEPSAAARDGPDELAANAAVEGPRELVTNASPPQAGAPAIRSALPAPAPTRDSAPSAPGDPQRVAESLPAAADTEAEPEALAEAAAEVAPDVPGTPIEGKERTRLERRFKAWTGSLEELERTVTWKDGGREYTAVLRRVPSDGAMGMEHLAVEISTRENGRKMSTEMRLARLSFSSFAQFVDRWDPNVAIHDDEIDGRFHSNSEVKLALGFGASPKFKGKVTLAAHTFDSDGPVSRNRLFPEGVELNVRRIALPSRLVPLTDGADVDAAQVQRFERDARITFYADATFGWQYLDSADPEVRLPLHARAQYLIGADEVELHVKGVVDGHVLVYTPDDIVIEDDLVYARDPRVHDDADDYVGLVAERTVTIAPPATTGNGDLTVQASIYARHQFAVRGIHTRRAGTLNIYGSLAAGSLTATEPRYATKIEFDKRLAGARPPGFPLSDRYELEDWSGEWRADAAEPGDDSSGELDAADDLEASESPSVTADAAVPSP